MLPFLKRKQDSVAGLIIKNRAPDKPNESEDLEQKEYSLEDCAQKLIEAVHSNDKAKVASALEEAFEKLEQEPHKEAEHPAPHSYEAQNIKAAQEG